MASSTRFVSIEQYLKSDYEPDAEYVDGEIEERAMPEYNHADWQFAICLWFQNHAKEWDVRVKPELRVRVGQTRFRIPDVTVLDRGLPIEQIIIHPPLAVFEVLSPEDRPARMTRKLNDYATMGIPEIWTVDPETRIFSRFESGQLAERSEFSLGSKSIRFSVTEIEALLD